MATAGPTITSVVRHTSDPTILVLTYTVPVSGVTRVQLWEKPTDSGTRPVRIVDTTSLTGTISVHSRYVADVAVSLHMTLTHVTEGTSSAGSTVNVPAFEVPAPTLVSAVRSSATRAALTYSGLVLGGGATVYVYRSAPGGNPTQVDAFTPSATSGTYQAPAPSGTAGYDFEIRLGRHSVLSDASTRRSVDAWYERPPAPVSFSAVRDATTGAVDLEWGMPTVTSRNRPIGYRLFKALKGRPLQPWHTRTTTSLTDNSTVLASGYDYGVEAYNEAGPSSSRPNVSVDAVRERPNAASGVTATHLGGNIYRITWSIDPRTERPITNQKLLGRVPGSTATTTLATVPADSTTYDLTLPENRIYEVAILPTNSVGDAASTSNWEGPIVSAPPALSALYPFWSDASTVRVAYTHQVHPSESIADGIEWQFSTLANPDMNDDGDWFPGGTVGLTDPIAQTGATSSVPHTYRARTVHVASGLVSAWVFSARLDSQAAPLAPTMDMPWRIDATGSIELRMQHNPVDGTAQTLGQIRYRLQGETTWTTRTLGTDDTYSIAAGTYTNGQALEVQGRTAGATGVYGEWGHVTVGASLLVPLRAKPTAAIISPAPGTFEAQTMTMTWTSVGQSSALLELWDDTGGNLQLLGTATVGADVRSYTWPVVLPDGRDIITQVQVRDPWQSGETQQVTVTVSYDLPAPPLLTAEQAEAASVLLQATPRSGLQTTRTNLASPDGWGSTLGTTSLLMPDGTYRDALTNPGASVDLTHANSGTGGRWLTVTLSADRATTAAMVNIAPPPIEVEVPAWPESVRVSLPAYSGVTPAGGPLLSPDPAARLYVMDAVISETMDVAHFDGDTIDPTGQRLYGWSADGTSWEAVPDDAGDRPVAPTVRIEIWCSDTGLPDSYTRCGETGTGWDYHDRHPRIGVPTWYMARAVAASGAWAESVPVQITVDSRDTFVHFGDDHGSYVTAGRLVDALTIDAGGLDVESIQYEGHTGWTHHVSDIPLAESISVDLQLLPARGASSLAEWAQALKHPDVIYREPGGIVMRGAPSMGPRRPSSRFVQRISLSVAGEML